MTKVNESKRTCDLMFVDYDDHRSDVAIEHLRKDTSANVERCPVFIRRCRLTGPKTKATQATAAFFKEMLDEQVVLVTLLDVYSDQQPSLQQQHQILVKVAIDGQDLAGLVDDAIKAQ